MMTEPVDEATYRARQKSRAKALAIVLFAMVALTYGVAIAKMVVFK
jgi:hypothetical protein